MTVTRENVRVTGAELMDRVKKLAHEGNVRRVVVTDARGRTVLDVPVTVGAGALILAPVVTTVGALAALAADWRIQIERTADS